MKSTKFKGGRIYEIPLADIERIEYFYGDRGNEEIKSATKRLTKLYGRQPDFVMNAELFDFKTRAAASDVVSDGVKVRLTEGYGFAFPENKTVVFSYKNNVNAKDYIGAYPVLVRNGKSESSIPAGIGGRRGRTALGLSKDALHVILIPDNTGATLPELRNKLVSDGVQSAINLDGGGSTQFYSPDMNYFSGRRVRGFVIIFLKKKDTVKKEPVNTPAKTPSTTTNADVRTVNTKKGLNVRSGPGLSFKRVGGIAYKTKVTVLEKSGTWVRIGYGRWVSSLYLKKVK